MDIQLSPAQRRVLSWLGKGWRTTPGAGSVVLVNGQRISNVDTLMALLRAGLVVKDDLGSWSATPEGKALTMKLGL